MGFLLLNGFVALHMICQSQPSPFIPRLQHLMSRLRGCHVQALAGEAEAIRGIAVPRLGNVQSESESKWYVQSYGALFVYSSCILWVGIILNLLWSQNFVAEAIEKGCHNFYFRRTLYGESLELRNSLKEGCDEVIIHGGKDETMWMLTTDRKFLVKSLYMILFKNKCGFP